jgi:DeoR/GlpR family transcriptional regulator of sugar metabolism
MTKRFDFGPGRQELERRVRRLLAIALVLRTRRLTRAELAQMFGVCERQVQRDLEVLKAAGLRIRRYNGAHRGYEAAWPEVPDLESFAEATEDKELER